MQGHDRAHSVRLVQFELERLLKHHFVGEIGPSRAAQPLKINTLAGAAGVDIAGVASSILATPTIFPNLTNRLAIGVNHCV
jgi:hypothetical protein